MDDVDWDRWDFLRDAHSLRDLTEDERREFERFIKVVAALDEEEDKRLSKSFESISSHHKKVLDSLDRLVTALENAAKKK